MLTMNYVENLPGKESPQGAIIVPPKKQGVGKKIWKSPITGAIFYLAMLLIVVTVFLYSDSSEAGVPRNFFGYSTFKVLTRSMQSVIPQGSFVLVKHVDPNSLEVGDDITFLHSNDTTFTHRIIAITENFYNGKRGFTTKGVENSAADSGTLIADNVVGKVVFHNLIMGRALSFIKSNLILSGILSALLLVLFAVLRYVFSSKGKHSRSGITNVNPKEVINNGS